MTEMASATEVLVLNGLDDLLSHVGTDLGVSSWQPVDQDAISDFGRLTNDQQWIHVDPERAKSGPFGATIQHGFLTLSLATSLLWEVCVVTGFDLVVNYGLNRVRFPAPLRAGSNFRLRVTLEKARELEAANTPAAEAVYLLTYEVQGSERPCCIAELVFRYYS